MRNNKGQALVEFVMIFPILIIIIMSLIDLGNIIINKYTLENKLDTIVEYYNNNEEFKIKVYANNNKLSYNSNKLENNLTEITVTKTVKTTAPIISKIMGKDIVIDASRQVYEQ